MHLDTFSDADNPNFQELVGVGDLVTFLDDEERCDSTHVGGLLFLGG
jgi:hypothetical protein